MGRGYVSVKEKSKLFNEIITIIETGWNVLNQKRMHAFL